MTAYGADRLLGLGEAVVSLDGADEVEVVLHRSDTALTRFAESRIHQNVARSDGSAGCGWSSTAAASESSRPTS